VEIVRQYSHEEIAQLIPFVLVAGAAFLSAPLVLELLLAPVLGPLADFLGSLSLVYVAGSA
jgi:hypothetical protein